MNTASIQRSFLLTVVLTLIVSAVGVSFAQNRTSAVTKIKNFGQMNERFFRGAQPKEEDYKDLNSRASKSLSICETIQPHMKRGTSKLWACGMSTFP